MQVLQTLEAEQVKQFATVHVEVEGAQFVPEYPVLQALHTLGV